MQNSNTNRKIYIPRRKTEILDESRLRQYHNNGISKNNKFAGKYTKSTI